MSASEMELVVTARPADLSIDPARTAVIVVDMQNDFGSDGGMFALAGIDISGIKAVVPTIARVLDAARRAGILVIYLKMAHRADLSDLGPAQSAHHQRHRRMHVGEATKAPDGTASRILIRDTWNTDIVRELTPKAGDITIYKHRYSGFFETELDEVLRGRGIKTLVFTGCTTSVCVESTFRDAVFRDYVCLLLEDCTSEAIGKNLARTNHDASVLVLEILFGWIAQSTAFLEAAKAKTMTAVA